MTQTKADKVIDGLSMEPPEPFVQTMDALDQIEPGQKILLIVRHEPFPLYRTLELNGCSWKAKQVADGSVEVLIWHKPK